MNLNMVQLLNYLVWPYRQKAKRRAMRYDEPTEENTMSNRGKALSETLQRNIQAAQHSARQQAQAASAQAGAEIRLLSLCTPDEVRDHPLRCLIRLFQETRVYAPSVYAPSGHPNANLLIGTFGKDCFSKFSDVIRCGAVRADEEACRFALLAFADAIEKEGSSAEEFFSILSPGQADLAALIANVVAGFESMPYDLLYTPNGLERHQTKAEHPSRAEEDDREEREDLKELDSAIAQLDRPGWPRTPAEQARIESLRARRADLTGSPSSNATSSFVDPRTVDAVFMAGKEAVDTQEKREKWIEAMRDLVQRDRLDAASVALTWESRMRALGGHASLGRTILGRAIHARDEYMRLRKIATNHQVVLAMLSQEAAKVGFGLERLAPVLEQADDLVGDVGREQFGDIAGLYEEMARRIADAVDRASTDCGNSARVLTRGERDLLIRCSKPDGVHDDVLGAVEYEVVERLARSQLVAHEGEDCSGIWKTTPAGRQAVESWRYEAFSE